MLAVWQRCLTSKSVHSLRYSCPQQPAGGRAAITASKAWLSTGSDSPAFLEQRLPFVALSLHRSVSIPLQQQPVGGRLWRQQRSTKLADHALTFERQHGAAPQVIGWVDFDVGSEQQKIDIIGMVEPESVIEILRDEDEASLSSSSEAMSLMNRNARFAKKANRGKRAVSRQRRRAKKRAFGNHRR